MIHKAAIVAEANGYPQKDLPMVSQTLPVKEPVLHDNPLVPAYNSTLPTYCGQSGAPGLTNNFNNPNNVLQSSRDELSWPKLLVRIIAALTLINSCLVIREQTHAHFHWTFRET